MAIEAYAMPVQCCHERRDLARSVRFHGFRGYFGFSRITPLKLVLQITEAFEVMNERSAIHRNLKSANIKATPNGKVKILNF